MGSTKKYFLLTFLMLGYFFLFIGQASADWTLDLSAPACSMSFVPGTVKATNTVTVDAILNDTSTGGSGILASSMTVTAIGAGAGGTSTLTSPTYLPTPCVGTTCTARYSWTPTVADYYTFNVGGFDLAGNQRVASSCQSYNVTAADPAWLQTSGGDVHVNK